MKTKTTLVILLDIIDTNQHSDRNFVFHMRVGLNRQNVVYVIISYDILNMLTCVPIIIHPFRFMDRYVL